MQPIKMQAIQHDDIRAEARFLAEIPNEHLFGLLSAWWRHKPQVS